jgi:hypothetical protein
MLDPHAFLCASLAIPPGRKMRSRLLFTPPSQNAFDLLLLSEQTRHFYAFTFHQRICWSHRHLSMPYVTVVPRSSTSFGKSIVHVRRTA